MYLLAVNVFPHFCEDNANPHATVWEAPFVVDTLLHLLHVYLDADRVNPHATVWEAPFVDETLLHLLHFHSDADKVKPQAIFLCHVLFFATVAFSVVFLQVAHSHALAAFVPPQVTLWFAYFVVLTLFPQPEHS